MSAELKASTRNLTGVPPQFEVLELQKLDDTQVRTVLQRRTKTEVVNKVMDQSKLLNLARRPVMIELILEALPELEEGKKVDLARIFLYAIKRKMERDIKAKRTFTSMADKLFFMCELSWEMLQTDRMQMNYRDFPERIRRFFPHAVREQKDLDHWHYDMMGQTILVRDANGDYSPAHRSFLEFFVAYKFAAELGALESDFIALAKAQSNIAPEQEAQDYTWSNYFKRKIINDSGSIEAIAPLNTFTQESIARLGETFGRNKLSKTVAELLSGMIVPDCLMDVISATRRLSYDEVAYTGGNAISLLRRFTDSFRGVDLTETVLAGADLFNTDFGGAKLERADLREADLSGCILEDASLVGANLYGLKIREMGGVDTVVWNNRGDRLASNSDDLNLRVWDAANWEQAAVLRVDVPIAEVIWSPDDRQLFAINSGGQMVAWDTAYWNQLPLSDILPKTRIMTACCTDSDPYMLFTGDSIGQVHCYEGRSLDLIKKVTSATGNPVTTLHFIEDKNWIAAGFNDGKLKVYRAATAETIGEYKGAPGTITALRFDHATENLVAYKGDYTVEVESYPKVLEVDEIDANTVREIRNRLIQDFIDEAWRAESERFFREHRREFKKTFAKELAADPSESELAKLKDEFLALELPVLYDEIVLWAEEMAQSQLEVGRQISTSWKVHSVGFLEEWNVNSGERQSYSWGPILHGTSSAFVSDSRLLIGQNDGSIGEWQDDAKKISKRLKQHAQPVRTLSYHPQKLLLASGSEDTTICIWDMDPDSSSYDQCFATLQIRMNCKNLHISKAEGLKSTSPNGRDTLGKWLVQRGAIR